MWCEVGHYHLWSDPGCQWASRDLVGSLSHSRRDREFGKVGIEQSKNTKHMKNAKKTYTQNIKLTFSKEARRDRDREFIKVGIEPSKKYKTYQTYFLTGGEECSQQGILKIKPKNATKHKKYKTHFLTGGEERWVQGMLEKPQSRNRAIMPPKCYRRCWFWLTEELLWHLLRREKTSGKQIVRGFVTQIRVNSWVGSSTRWQEVIAGGHPVPVITPSLLPPPSLSLWRWSERCLCPNPLSPLPLPFYAQQLFPFARAYICRLLLL